MSGAMSGVDEPLIVECLELDMGGGRKPKPVGRPSIGKQTNVRLAPAMLTHLEYIAKTMDDDISGVIRNILAEHISEHLERASAIRERRARVQEGLSTSTEEEDK